MSHWGQKPPHKPQPALPSAFARLKRTYETHPRTQCPAQGLSHVQSVVERHAIPILSTSMGGEGVMTLVATDLDIEVSNGRSWRWRAGSGDRARAYALRYCRAPDGAVQLTT